MSWFASATSPPVATWLRSWHSYCCSLTVTVPVYFTLGGCCGVVILLFEKYFALGGCSGPERELLLFESDGSLAFLETDATCLFDSGRLVWT